MNATDTATANDAFGTEQESGLLDFNRQVLDQALALIDQFTAIPGPVGAHLRHLVEHYAALLSPAQAGVVDYDARPRERALESDKQLLSSRLRALRQQLAAWPAAALAAPLRVRGQCGLLGDRSFEVTSTVGRELAFVASHAIHHFAVLALHGRAAGMQLAEDFGKAPSTVAHERTSAGTRLPVNTPATEDPPCTDSIHAPSTGATSFLPLPA